MGIKSLVKQWLVKKQNRVYQDRLAGIQISYPAWLQEQSGLLEDFRACGQASLSGDGAGEAGGHLVAICASEGVFSCQAVEGMGKYFVAHPEVALAYGDEDVRGECRPWFKPDWSPDLLDSFFYFGSVVVLRRELFDQICALYGSTWGCFTDCFSPEQEEQCQGKGSWLSGKVERFQVTELDAYISWMHMCVSMTEAYCKGSRAIGHMPGILFHCATQGEQEKFRNRAPFLEQEQVRLLRDFKDGLDAGPGPGRPPVISIVIPSRDHPRILEKCIKGCKVAVAHISSEILVVDNGSSLENQQEIRHITQELAGEDFQIRYLYQSQEFHFSRMCNLGAEAAKGEYLLFLNDDVELCQPGCLVRMAAMADRPYTGAVGQKLYYPDSTRIQHAGITNLPMGPVHKMQFLPDEEEYYFGANRGIRNVLAVTAACLMVEKAKYLEAGGFSEHLRVAFNDVDFCFRLYELGYHNVCMNDGYAYHHESLSRGDDESEAKLDRLLAEREELYRCHPGLVGRDPYYSRYLNREGLDTRIRPGYETAGNRVQEVEELEEGFGLEDYRQDACLLFRVEDCREGRILGYGVVLGDDNACYDTWLLFKKIADGRDGKQAQEALWHRTDTGSTFSPGILAVRCKAQYRPDLEENMPDQVHVALSGYDIHLAAWNLPAGTYRLGMAARNRVTGTRLVNWSNRKMLL